MTASSSSALDSRLKYRRLAHRGWQSSFGTAPKSSQNRCYHINRLRWTHPVVVVAADCNGVAADAARGDLAASRAAVGRRAAEGLPGGTSDLDAISLASSLTDLNMI